jgi:prevent-host-death family protein
MKRVGLFEAKTHLSELVSEVDRTQEYVVIQRRGKDVAAIVPCQEAMSRADKEKAEWILRTLDEIRSRQRPPKPGERIKDLITEGRRR